MATKKKAAEETAVETDTTQRASPAFTKSKLLTFGKYKKRRDLLSVLLEDGETYTTGQVDKLLKNFLGDDA